MSGDEAAASTAANSKTGLGVTLDAIGVILLAVTLGFLASGVYGLQWGIGSAILALLASVLGYAAGGLMGFLFGFPRYLEARAISSTEDLKGASGEGASLPSPGLQPNTNLERIVDWLMTMIVGATLVNLQQLASWSAERFSEVGNAITGTPNSVPGALLILPYAIGGFLHLYLWARRYLPEEWTLADKSMLRKQTEELGALKEEVVQVRSSQEKVENTVSEFRGEVFRLEERKIRDLIAELGALGVPSPIISEVARRFANASSWDDDPFKDFAPEHQGRLAIDATVSEAGDGEDSPYAAEVRVVAGTEPPLAGDIVFLLHNTYDTPYVTVKAGESRPASTTFRCFEAFTVGAIAVERSADGSAPVVTTLAIDLAKLPGVPKGFLPA